MGSERPDISFEEWEYVASVPEFLGWNILRELSGGGHARPSKCHSMIEY